MFRITIEVWPHGNYLAPSHKTHIVGCNDGTSRSSERGNYQAIVADPEKSPSRQITQLTSAMERGEAAKVENFPRGSDQEHLPSLAMALIQALGLDEVYVDWQTDLEIDA